MKWYKTQRGKISQTYSKQKGSSLKRGHPLPSYSKEELEEWLFSQKLWFELYDNWVLSDFKKKLAPSIDRINDNLPYTIGNIQLMTWEENHRKGYETVKSGVHQTQQKAVEQFDNENKFIAKYVSIKEASRQTGINDYTISLVCKNKRITAGGYIWKYKIRSQECSKNVHNANQ